VFNASQPINPNGLVALRSRISNQKIELDKKIRASVANLQQASNLCLSQRAKLASSANQAIAARKQAELDEQAATGPLYKASKVISLCCAVLATTPPGSQVARQGETTAQPIPLAPPISQQNPEMSAKNGDEALNGAIVRNLSQKDDAIQVQRRLAELGFLSGSVDGKWGSRSKRALLEYKESSGLDKMIHGTRRRSVCCSVIALRTRSALYLLSADGLLG
jgi:hypothetical protein